MRCTFGWSATPIIQPPGASPLFWMVVLEQSTTASAVPPSTDTPNTAFGLAVKVNVAMTFHLERARGVHHLRSHHLRSTDVGCFVSSGHAQTFILRDELLQ